MSERHISRRYFGVNLLSALSSLLLLIGVTAQVTAQVGTPFAWGRNFYGQLGTGTSDNSNTPVQTTGISNVTQLAAGSQHTLALTSEGAVWVWGQNDFGQLGDGASRSRLSPFQLTSLAKIVQVSAGYWHSLALKADGTVWAWGYNAEGELGIGTNDDRHTPFQVNGLTGIVQISGGYQHSLALRADGTVWAWGYNNAGQLGNGTNVDKNVPVQVSGLSGVVQIAGGGFHSLALKSDGTVWAWGYNNNGQIGDGKSVDRWKPVQAKSLSGIVQLTAGQYHSLALKSDGTVWGWGNNEKGELGDGSNTTSYTPVQALSLTNIVHIAAGSYHSLAAGADGTVWAWGKNKYGQLGNGNNTDSAVAIQVTGLTNQTAVFAGEDFSLSLQALKQNTGITLVSTTQPFAGNVTARLKNKIYGNMLVQKSLRFTVDGNVLGTANTIANGIASRYLTDAYSLGDHTVTVEFLGDRLFYAASPFTFTLTITKADTTLATMNASGGYGHTRTLTALLKRKTDGAPLANQSLTVKVDGASIGSFTTDGTGKVVVYYKIEESLSVGNHTWSAEFAGDTNHNATSASGMITVSQMTTTLTETSLTAKAGTKVYLTAKIKRASDGKFLEGRTIHFLVDGVAVGDATTNASGVARFLYSVPSTMTTGAHSLGVGFDGDDFYLSSSGSAILTVK